jgi:hypothetical protein
MSRFKRRLASRYVHRLEGDGVEKVWTSRGDRVKIMALRAQVSPVSAAGPAMLSPIRTKWDIRGTQRSRRASYRQNRRQQPTAAASNQMMNLKLARALNSRPTDENTLVMRSR